MGSVPGLECIGKKYAGAGVLMTAGKASVYFEMGGKPQIITSVNSTHHLIYLKLNLDETVNRHWFSYSLDGKTYHPCGDTFSNFNKDWKGVRVGLYSYTTNKTGKVYFDDFVYHHDGPQ